MTITAEERPKRPPIETDDSTVTAGSLTLEEAGLTKADWNWADAEGDRLAAEFRTHQFNDGSLAFMQSYCTDLLLRGMAQKAAELRREGCKR